MTGTPHAGIRAAHDPFHKELAHAAEGVIAIWLAASFLVQSVMSLASAVGGTHDGQTTMAATAPWIGVVVGGKFAHPLFDWILVCVVTGFIVYMVLRYVCEARWVTEQHKITECWEEFVWYNPWTWVKSVVCSVKWVAVQVLRWICRWKEVLVVIAVVSCVIAGIIVLL